MTADVRPFPYAALEALTRADVAAAARLRRAARAYVRGEAFAAALGELIGEEDVSIRLDQARRMATARSADDGVGVVLAPADAPHSSSTMRVLVELEGVLAAALVMRALRQRAPRITDPARPAAAEVAGAAAAVLLAALRRAHSGIALRVVAAGPGHALARDLAAAEPAASTASLTVTIGPDAFAARVSVSDALDARITAPPLTADALRACGDAPLALPLVVATAYASRADLDALAPGDAFVFACAGELPLAIGEGGALTGPVTLVAPRSLEAGIGADLAPDGRLVIRNSAETKGPMPSDTSRTIEALEDAPVVVRVELGVVEMKARDWAALGAGDVVMLGRKIGDPAVLRVGGVAIARGEIVTVDGEVAVRIVSRGGAEE